MYDKLETSHADSDITHCFLPLNVIVDKTSICAYASGRYVRAHTLKTPRNSISNCTQQ